MTEMQLQRVEADRRLLLRRAKAKRQEESLRATAEAMEREYRMITPEAAERMQTPASEQLSVFRAEHLR